MSISLLWVCVRRRGKWNVGEFVCGYFGTVINAGGTH